MWQAEASDMFQQDGGQTAGGVVNDHSAGIQENWADQPQVLQHYNVI